MDCTARAEKLRLEWGRLKQRRNETVEVASPGTAEAQILRVRAFEQRVGVGRAALVAIIAGCLLLDAVQDIVPLHHLLEIRLELCTCKHTSSVR